MGVELEGPRLVGVKLECDGVTPCIALPVVDVGSASGLARTSARGVAILGGWAGKARYAGFVGCAAEGEKGAAGFGRSPTIGGQAFGSL